MQERIKHVIAAVFGLDDQTITEESCSINTIEQWDSLQQIRLVLALEQEFGIEFDDEEIPQLTNFSTIQSLVSDKTLVM
ncbi:acyl carrier protein [bacterium]|nr:acyl carrier protein [bacterium]MCP5462279.1 acyl carrier protein [bacterium]